MKTNLKTYLSDLELTCKIKSETIKKVCYEQNKCKECVIKNEKK